MSLQTTAPKVAENVFVAPNATIIGAVTIEEGASIWFNSVIRADTQTIYIGPGCNIQDNAVIHVDSAFPVSLDSNVTVGHSAIIHGAHIGDNCVIGMGAIVMNGCNIGRNCLIGAGALVTQNTVIPDGYLVLGSPAKAIRPLKPEEIEHVHANAAVYIERGAEYKNNGYTRYQA